MTRIGRAGYADRMPASVLAAPVAHGVTGAVLAIVALLWVPAGHARWPAQAPVLPMPDPQQYTIVHVATAQALANACWNLASNRAIVIAPGTYDLASVSFPNGVDGRLTVGRFGAAPITNIVIRGATDDPRDVVVRGAGMLDARVPYGFQLFTARQVTIANLSVSGVFYHGIGIEGPQGARDIHLYNLRVSDAGQQLIKGSGAGADDVLVEYVEAFYTEGAVAHPYASPPNTCYTNGIDITGGHRWTIRDSLIRDIRCQDGSLAGPAILAWQGSMDTVVDRSVILDSSRGVALGLIGPADHLRGMVRNTLVRWDVGASYAVDVPLYTTSPDARLLHNTVLTRGRYGNAVEVRYAGATGVEVHGNLADAAIMPRNGAVPVLGHNVTSAQAAWFVDAATGDLRLTAQATPALSQVARRADAERDFTGHMRRSPPVLTDLGGLERQSDTLFASGFESLPPR